MSSKRVVRENGKEIPFDEWATREYRKLRVKMECASTGAELRAVEKEAKHLNTVRKLMSTPWNALLQEAAI